jgi:hypothetical protein
VLTVAALAAHLGRLEFMPGWTVTLYDGRFEGPHIVIRATVPNSYQPAEVVDLDIHSALPPMPDLAYFEVWLEWRLRRIWGHEVREWLRRDDRPVFDPHGPQADQDR